MATLMIDEETKKMIANALKAAFEWLAGDADRIVECLPENTKAATISVEFDAESLPEITITTASIPQVIIGSYTMKGVE